MVQPSNPHAYTVTPLDPLSSDTASLTPELASRILLFAQDISGLPAEKAAEFVRRTLARVVLADPNLRVLVVLDGEQVVGHAVGEVAESDRGDKCLFIHQVEVDPGAPGAIDKVMEAGHNYGRSMGATRMQIEASGHRHEIWTRRWGFKLISYTMERDLCNGKQEIQAENHRTT